MREPHKPAAALQPGLLSTMVFMPSRTEVLLDDPAFERIVAMVERGQFHAAAVAAQERWLARSYDVRVLGYFLYGVYLGHGAAALPAIFDGAREFLSHWDFLGPEERKAQHADSTLHWLFRRLARELEARPPAGDADRAVLLRARERIPALSEVIERVTESRRCVERLQLVAHVLEDVARAPLDELPPGPDHPADPPEALDPEADLDAAPDAGSPDGVDGVERVERAAGSGGGAARLRLGAIGDPPGVSSGQGLAGPPHGERAHALGHAETVTLPLGLPLRTLLRKLDAFQRLVERQDYQRAAVLAADVQDALDRFDPRVHLPQLFAAFFRTLAASAPAIEPWLHQADSLAARALAQHCQVDLEGFLEGGVEGGAEHGVEP